MNSALSKSESPGAGAGGGILSLPHEIKIDIFSRLPLNEALAPVSKAWRATGNHSDVWCARVQAKRWPKLRTNATSPAQIPWERHYRAHHALNRPGGGYYGGELPIVDSLENFRATASRLPPSLPEIKVCGFPALPVLQELVATYNTVRALTFWGPRGPLDLESLKTLGTLPFLESLTFYARLDVEAAKALVNALPQLKELALPHCNTSPEVLKILCGLSQLQRLDLSEDILIDELPPEAKNLKALRALNLSGRLRGPNTVPNDRRIRPVILFRQIADWLPNLEELDLSQRALPWNSAVLAPLGELTKLHTLSLRLTHLREFPAALCTPTLRSLDLSENPGLKLPEEFGSMQCMTHLDLRNCAFDAVPTSVAGFKHLRVLNLFLNKNIQFPKTLPNWSSLQVLNLSLCDLKTVPEAIFDLPKLRWLLLFSNRITAIEDGVKGLESLDTLDMRHNPFVEFPQAVLSLKNLRRLALSDYDFHLKKYPNLAPLKTLRSLDVSFVTGTGQELQRIVEGCASLTVFDCLAREGEFTLPRDVSHIRRRIIEFTHLTLAETEECLG